jgi:hypothetical protein
MAALPIVEHLDVLKNVLGGFVPCGVVPMVHQLTLGGETKGSGCVGAKPEERRE